MDNLLKSVFDLPDVSFIDNDSLDAMMQRLVANYEKRYKEVTGQTISLGAADPVRVQLYAVALDLFQIEQYVDRAGKQDYRGRQTVCCGSGTSFRDGCGIRK